MRFPVPLAGDVILANHDIALAGVAQGPGDTDRQGLGPPVKQFFSPQVPFFDAYAWIGILSADHELWVPHVQAHRGKLGRHTFEEQTDRRFSGRAEGMYTQGQVPPAASPLPLPHTPHLHAHGHQCSTKNERFVKDRDVCA